MEFNEGFKYAMGWNPSFLKMMGVWPELNDGIFSRQKTWLYGFAVFIINFLPQSASIIVIWGDMDAVIESLSFNVAVFLTILKVLNFHYYRHVIAKIINMMNEDWEAFRNIEEHKVMMKNATISHNISIASTILSSTVFVAFIIFSMWFGWEMNKRTDLDERLSIGLPHRAYLPYNTKKFQYFLPTWIVQCVLTYFSTMSYTSFDCCISAFVLHISGQLTIIGISLKNLVNEMNHQDTIVYLTTFAAIIKRHERLIQMSEIIENSFNKILLYQMLICTVTFCLQGYSIIASLVGDLSGKLTIVIMLFSIVYAIYTSLHLFVYCYIGDCLSYESEYISQNYYNSQWYKLPYQQMKWLLFVNYRSQRPLKLTAGKFCTFSINLFIIILKTSAGYLSMLLAVKQRKLTSIA